jgi:hypothetical protein
MGGHIWADKTADKFIKRTMVPTKPKRQSLKSMFVSPVPDVEPIDEEAVRWTLVKKRLLKGHELVQRFFCKLELLSKPYHSQFRTRAGDKFLLDVQLDKFYTHAF